MKIENAKQLLMLGSLGELIEEHNEGIGKVIPDAFYIFEERALTVQNSRTAIRLRWETRNSLGLSLPDVAQMCQLCENFYYCEIEMWSAVFVCSDCHKAEAERVVNEL